MVKIINLFSIILLLTFINSCGTESITSYYIQNNLSDSTRIESDTLLVELFVVVGGETKTFSSVEKNTGQRTNATQFVLDIFATAVITNLGNSKQSTTDFSVLDNWIYEKVSEDIESYTLIIDEDDF